MDWNADNADDAGFRGCFFRILTRISRITRINTKIFSLIRVICVIRVKKSIVVKLGISHIGTLQTNFRRTQNFPCFFIL